MCTKRDAGEMCSHHLCEFGHGCVDLEQGFCEMGSDCNPDCEYSWQPNTEKAKEADRVYKEFLANEDHLMDLFYST